MNRRLPAFFLAFALALAFVPDTALANGLRASDGLLDAGPQDRSNMLSLFGFVPWGTGVGVAVRYSLPIVPQGFISKLNDSFELEFGGDVYTSWRFLDDFGFVIPLEARWTFHIIPKLSAYAKASVGFEYYTAFGWGGANYLYWDLNPGVIFQFSDAVAFRAEFGYRGLRAGVGFTF